MNRSAGIFIAMIVSALLAVAVFFLVDMGSEKSFTSPEEAFEAARIALKKGDMRGWCQCLTDDSRDFMAVMMVIDEFMAKQVFGKVGSDEKKARVRAVDQVFTQHGLTDDALTKQSREFGMLDSPQVPMEQKLAFAQDVLKPVRDRNGFIADLFQAIQKTSEADKRFDVLKNAKLGDVKIAGKSATAIVFIQQGGEERPGPLQFRKQGEGWRIDLFGEEKQERQRPGLPPGHP